MKTAYLPHAGAIHTASPHARGVQLADGRVLADADVVWLPPFDVGTIIAPLGSTTGSRKELSKELTITTKDEPLGVPQGPAR